MVIFQYNLYIFVRILHSCLTNTVYVMDPNNTTSSQSIKELFKFNDKYGKESRVNLGKI